MFWCDLATRYSGKKTNVEVRESGEYSNRKQYGVDVCETRGARCSMQIVESEDEGSKLARRGWRSRPVEAIRPTTRTRATTEKRAATNLPTAELR
jgi:hypothetical protein